MTSDLREPPVRAPRERSAPQPPPHLPGRAGEAVPNPVWSTCLARPKHPTLVSGDLVWSAGDLAAGVQRFAGRLVAAGVRPGDRGGRRADVVQGRRGGGGGKRCRGAAAAAGTAADAPAA